jgi:hypothetical protein
LLAHTIIIEVFIRQDEDIELIKEKLLTLIPFDLKEEKVELKRKTSKGFNKEKIVTFTIILSKKRHIKQFLEDFIEKLGEQSKELMSQQIERRLDNEFYFYIRLDKFKLINEQKLELTEAGDCIYVKIKVAVFPQKREKAIEEIRNYLH